jgi:MFS family permease
MANAAIPDRDLRRVVIASLIGATIEWYDFFLYGTVAGIVFNKLFFPVQDPLISILLAYTTFAVGFVARPLGGVIFGHFGDRIHHSVRDHLCPVLRPGGCIVLRSVRPARTLHWHLVRLSILWNFRERDHADHRDLSDRGERKSALVSLRVCSVRRTGECSVGSGNPGRAIETGSYARCSKASCRVGQI